MNDSKPIKDIDDQKEAFRDLLRQHELVASTMVALGIEHTNKIVGKLTDNPIYHLRDELLYRMRCVLIHVDMLQSSYDSALRYLNHDPTRKIEFPPLLMDQFAEEQFAIFDSIVFHSSAVLDYAGNLVEFICGRKNGLRRKWNGAVKAARDPRNPISDSAVATCILRLDKEWVDKFFGHRSSVIHYRSAVGGRTISQSFPSARYDLGIYAPPKFIRHFPDLELASRSHHLTLRYVAMWFAKCLCVSVREVIHHLRHDLERLRRVPDEDAVFVDIRKNS